MRKGLIDGELFAERGRTSVRARVARLRSKGWQIASRRPQRVMWSGTSGAPTAPKKIASWFRIWSRPSAGIMTPCFL